MDATKRTAHIAGVLYVLMGVAGFYNLMIVPAGLGSTAAAVASHIGSAELTYRVGLLSGLISDALFVVLAVVLYGLFRTWIGIKLACSCSSSPSRSSSASPR